jgi:predicted lipid-binding transport protein (Tim44 family)
MQLEIELEGRRYTEDRDTRAILSGSRTHRTRFTEHWTMGRSDDEDEPWRIVPVAAPATA